jgi:hypothetical protein
LAIRAGYLSQIRGRGIQKRNFLRAKNRLITAFRKNFKQFRRSEAEISRFKPENSGSFFRLSGCHIQRLGLKTRLSGDEVQFSAFIIRNSVLEVEDSDPAVENSVFLLLVSG